MKTLLKDKFMITFIVIVLAAVCISSTLEVKMVKENTTPHMNDIVYNNEN